MQLLYVKIKHLKVLPHSHEVADLIPDLCGFAIAVLMYLLYEIEYLVMYCIKCDYVEVIYVVLIDTRRLHDIAVGG